MKDTLRLQALIAAASWGGLVASLKDPQPMRVWRAPGKQNRRGTPIVPGRLTANGKGYARLGNGALVVAMEPEKERTDLRPKRTKRQLRRFYAYYLRTQLEGLRQDALTARLQRRHSLKQA